MSVDQTDVIDIIGIDKKTGYVVLTISDHLEWEGDNDHHVILQEKLNTYLSFIESGEIYESYPQASGKKFLISVYGRNEPDEEGLKFLAKVKKIIEEAGFYFEFILHEESNPFDEHRF